MLFPKIKLKFRKKETCFCGGLSSARLTVGLDVLKGLFILKEFYEPVNLPSLGLDHFAERKE